jgi:hypothetical protein
MKYFLYTIVLLLTTPVFGQTPSVSVNAKADTTVLRIGEQTDFRLSVTQTANTSVTWPLIPEKISDHIDIVERYPTDTVFSDAKERITYTQRYRITSFDSGMFYIPAYTFSWVSGADTLFASTDSIALYVNTVPIKNLEDIKDIKGPLDMPFHWSEVIDKVLIAAGVLVVLIIGVWLLVRYLRKRPVVVPSIAPEPVIPADTEALERMDALKLRQLWQNGQTKLYYTELTDIIRLYIRRRFGVDATEMTTDELFGVLKLHLETNEVVTTLRLTFELADLVKFAKSNPVGPENESAMDTCRRFVTETSVQDKGKEDA